MDILTSEALVQQARAFLNAEGLQALGEAGLASRTARGVTPEVVKRSKVVKTQGVRQQGDPELTEPDSDDDSLLGDDPPDCSVFQPIELSKSPESLSAEELIKRRLNNVKALFSSYKVEYWSLLEELRTRHERFRTQQQKGTEKPADAGKAEVKESAGEDDSVHVRQLAKKQKTDHQPSGSGSPTSVAAGGAIFGPAQEAQVNASQAEAVSQPAATAQTASASQEPTPIPASAAAAPTKASEQGPVVSEGVSTDVRGYGSEEEPVTFSDAEAVVLKTQDQPGAASKEKIRNWRAEFRKQLPHLSRLEQAASASSCRELDRSGAIACFCGRYNRFIIRNTAITLGRATDTNQVDIDLSTEGDARKVSRLQAQLSLRPNGRFQLNNIGRRRVLVNNCKVDQGQTAQLSHLSLVEIGGARLLFMVNHAATKRASHRSLQLRHDF